MRPATHEEASGLDMVRNLIPELSEDIRRGRLQEGEPQEDEEMDAGDSAPDVRHGSLDSQPEPERAEIPEDSVLNHANNL